MALFSFQRKDLLILEDGSAEVFLLLWTDEGRREAFPGESGTRPPAETVKVLFIESEDDVGRVLHQGSRRFSAYATQQLGDKQEPLVLDHGDQVGVFSALSDEVDEILGGGLHGGRFRPR